MHLIKQAFEKGTEIAQARVVHFSEDGSIEVKMDHTDQRLTCQFLKTHEGPLPKLYVGTRVLCILDGLQGYVIGVIQPYQEFEKKQVSEIEIPDALNITAKNSIQITCGETSLSLRKDGKVFLKGKEITSRASGTNKIKGGTIRLN